jgi:hypothetical protein
VASGGAAAPKAVMTEEHQLTGHRGSVLCARVSRGRLLFSGSVDGTVKVGLQCHSVSDLATDGLLEVRPTSMLPYVCCTDHRSFICSLQKDEGLRMCRCGI